MKPLILTACLLAPCTTSLAAALPGAGEKVTVKLPDYGAELRAFNEPERRPISWWPHVVNAAWGGGRGGPERRGGWLDKNWKLVDYLDRSTDYTTHEYLTHRGIWYEVYGSNEYQETIHFHEKGARELFWDNGIARDMDGRRVLSRHYNTSVAWWAKKIGWDAYIVCNNTPRWSAVIDYDWLTSPLLGHAISQDNIGGPTSRIGAGGHGRYCDFCNAKFRHHLATTGRLPEFRRKYARIRDYVREHCADALANLPPKVKWRGDRAAAERLASLCAPPVLSEYQKFLYMSHLHNMVRYYRDAKRVARRVGREYDVHGNQGGSFIGPTPYQVALSEFVDTVWFESKGISAYDIFKYRWNNAWGSFRYVIGRAMTRARRPFMSMTGFHKHTPDMVEHELAEACAGGGVLFVQQMLFEKEPELLEKVTDYFRFRHAHRALYANPGRRSYAQVAIGYSVPTLMYGNYQYAADTPPANALSGMARAFEEGHIPYDVVIFNHPEIHADHVTLEQLRRYRLIVLPSLTCLSNSQIRLLADYARAGGVLGVVGECGVRDENNVARREATIDGWRAAGRVVDLLPDAEFLPCRRVEDDQSLAITRQAIACTRQALGEQAILTGALPRMLWVKAWRHEGGFVALHFVNYDVDFRSGAAAPTKPVEVSVSLPPALPAEEACWLAPGEKPRPLRVTVRGRKATFELPSVRVYGVVLIGRKGLDARASAALQARALHARARLAGASKQEATDAEAVLDATCRRQDKAYVNRVAAMADTAGVRLALDFGGKKADGPWRSVGGDSRYDPKIGFGWLPEAEAPSPTPEELYYDMAERHGKKIATRITACRLLFWPYRTQPPTALRTNLGCGSARRFRVDVPAGVYAVRVVTTCPSWTNRNFLVSGMAAVNGQVKLLDAVHDKGSLVSREFTARASDGRLELVFGGPTGWGVATLTVRPAAGDAPDALATGGLRSWRVSPRFANPDWYPIRQTACPPETRLTRLPDADWTRVAAPADGLPVIDLGTNRQADVGDVVYAVASVDSDKACDKVLHFGASSAAQLWLNGETLGYVPNEKGVRRDEFVTRVRLHAGRNTLVVKLARFWERRWLYYAALCDPS